MIGKFINLLRRFAAFVGDVQASTVYRVECYGPDGRLKWADEARNLVVTEGRTDLLERYFRGSAYTAAHYIGLTDGTPTPAAGDTMGSHAGWAEVTAYSQAARPTYTPGAAAAGSIDNSASRGEFGINADATVIGGLFLTTSPTKGGTAGTLYGVAPFSGGDRTLGNGDTLQVTATATVSAA